MAAEVKGKCPACGWSGLFLGSGGYVTCSQYDCPDPCRASAILAIGDKVGKLLDAAFDALPSSLVESTKP